MKKNKLDFKRTIIHVVVIFLFIAAIYTVFSYAVRKNINELNAQEIETNERELVDIRADMLAYKINRLTGDLLYIADIFDSHNLNTTEGLSSIANDWMAFANRMKIYDQIRFIDAGGQEIIRVNYNADGAYLTAGADLQDKSNRDYVQATLALPANSIYLSRFDLNIEHGLIEEPLKPTLRVSMPVYHDGELQGIIVMNYLADDLLKIMNIKPAEALGAVYLLDSDSYWIVNSAESSVVWGFMYDDLSNQNFAASYPDIWKQIVASGSGFIISEEGVFSYTNIFSNAAYRFSDHDYQLYFQQAEYYVVTNITPNSVSWQYFNDNPGALLLTVLQDNSWVYLLLLMIAAVIGYFTSARLHEHDKIRYFSEHDGLTGVYNRRIGLIKLRHLYKKAYRSKLASSICFFDVNGLKEINDVLGHTVGDEMIKAVIEIIQKKVRPDDIIARLGGDEFIIIFRHADKPAAEVIWERIRKEFELVNQKENRAYNIVVAHGIRTFNEGDLENVDQLLNEADALMYEEKRLLKNQFVTIKDLDNTGRKFYE